MHRKWSGEMADADYGYVGAGRGKISLYKGKGVRKRKNIPEEEAVERLLELSGQTGRKPTMILYWARNTGDGVLSS